MTFRQTSRIAAAAAIGLIAASTAHADDRPVLTVYTYDSFVSEWGPGPVVEPLFEEVCGCDLQLVAAGDGAQILSRLRLEGDASEADIALGLDSNLIAQAAATGLFAPHRITPPSDLAVPGGWEDPLFLPFDWGHFAFVYDSTKLADAPDSFEALLAAPADVTLIIQDPRTSTPGLGLLLWVKAVYGDDAKSVWERLAPRIVTVTKGWGEAYGAFLEGEAAMVLSYTTSPAYHAIAEGDPTKRAAFFSDGHAMQIEVAGKLAGSDTPELADLFLDFMLSEPFQGAIPTTNWMFPVVTPSAGLPEGFTAPPAPPATVTISPDDAAKLRAAALAEWRDALSQ